MAKDNKGSKKTAVKKKAIKSSAKSVKKKSSSKSTAKKSAGGRSKRQKASGSQDRKFVLDSVLVINNASTMHGQLNALVKAGSNIIIDAESVEMVDTSILQLLLSFVYKLKSLDLSVKWINPSKEFIKRAEILALKTQLGLEGE